MADDVLATQVAQRCIEQLPERTTWTFPRRPELLLTFEERGGIDIWAREIGTKHLTSTRAAGAIEGAATHEAAASLLEAGVPLHLASAHRPDGRDEGVQ